MDGKIVYLEHKEKIVYLEQGENSNFQETRKLYFTITLFTKDNFDPAYIIWSSGLQSLK